MEVVYEQPLAGQEEYLKHLASPDKLCLIGRKDVSSVAAIVERDGVREVVGLMILQQGEGRQIDLIWLYVDNDYRKMGIARTFLKILYDAGRRFRADWISTDFYQEMMGDLSADDLAEYLTKHGIPTTASDDGPWVIPGDMFAEEAFVLRADEIIRNHNEGLIFLDKLTAYERNACMAELASEKKQSWEYVDQNISCAIMKDGKWKGLLAIAKFGDVYTPLVFTATDNETSGLLLAGMASRLGRKIKPLEYFRVEEDPRQFSKKMGNMFPNIKRLGFFLGGTGIK